MQIYDTQKWCIHVLLAFVLLYVSFFFIKQKTASDMRISDWSSDVCSSDLATADQAAGVPPEACGQIQYIVDTACSLQRYDRDASEIGRASCRERVCQ